MERVADQRQNHRRRNKARRREARLSPDVRIRPDRILRQIEPLSWLRRSERSLLHHFVTQASCTVISSRHGQRLFCNIILPIALQSPAVLYSTLAYSAAQQAGLRMSAAPTAVDPRVSKYVDLSISSFQTELLRASGTGQASLLAASLLLCLVSVSSGEIRSGAWRIHAEGAKALLSSIHSSNANFSNGSAELEAIVRFLSRWCLGIESLTSITSSGLVAGQCVIQDATSGTISEPREYVLDVCDDHFGYPTKLAFLFREIGASAWERKRQASLSCTETLQIPFLTQPDFDIIADTLQSSLDKISADFSCPTCDLKFYPGVRDELSEDDIRDFAASTKAYLCMAQILIETRVRGMPSSSKVVQKSVRTIIQAVRSLNPSEGSTPAMAIGPALFAAGCEALEQVDRQAVRQCYDRLNTEVRSENMHQTLNMLEAFWKTDRHTVPDWLVYQGELSTSAYSIITNVSQNHIIGISWHIKVTARVFM